MNRLPKMMMCTSSTPWPASMSRTISKTVWRMSGVAIGGSGRLMSSTAIVTFIPGSSCANSGSQPSGWFSA